MHTAYVLFKNQPLEGILACPTVFAETPFPTAVLSALSAMQPWQSSFFSSGCFLIGSQKQQVCLFTQVNEQKDLHRYHSTLLKCYTLLRRVLGFCDNLFFTLFQTNHGYLWDVQTRSESPLPTKNVRRTYEVHSCLDIHFGCRNPKGIYMAVQKLSHFIVQYLNNYQERPYGPMT